MNKLAAVKAISVAKENKVSGVVEKVYAVVNDPYKAVTKELKDGSKSEYLNHFYNYLMTLLGDFERYIEKDNIYLMKDGVSFRSVAVYMSDEEYGEFRKDLIHAIDKVRDNKPAPERSLRKISTIVMPGVDD